MVSVRLSWAESGAERFGGANVPLPGARHLAVVRQRTVSGGSDHRPTPATCRVLHERTRALSGLDVGFGRAQGPL